MIPSEKNYQEPQRPSLGDKLPDGHKPYGRKRFWAIAVVAVRRPTGKREKER